MKETVKKETLGNVTKAKTYIAKKKINNKVTFVPLCYLLLIMAAKCECERAFIADVSIK